MIPGIGAAIRLGRGAHRKHQLEARIHDLEKLCSTPAVTHYEGLQRFEIAAVITDAKVGLLLDSCSSEREFADEAETYLQVMEREFVMVLEQATTAPATKAEVYALGMALKEIALSFDDAVTDFRTTADGRLARLDREAEASRNDTAKMLASADRSFRTALEECKGSAGAVISEIGQRADEQFREVQRLQSELSEMHEEWSTARSDVRHGLAVLTESCEALLADISRQAEVSLGALQRGLAEERGRLTQAVQEMQVSTDARLERAVATGEAQTQTVLGRISIELAQHRGELDDRVSKTRTDLESTLRNLQMSVVGLAVLICLIAGFLLLR